MHGLLFNFFLLWFNICELHFPADRSTELICIYPKGPHEHVQPQPQLLHIFALVKARSDI